LSLHEAGSTNRLNSKLQDILDAIKKRRKILIIADKSPGGWETVNEYLTDDVASDSDDDKRIRQAESQALAKKKARQVKLYYNKQYPKNTSSLSFPQLRGLPPFVQRSAGSSSFSFQGYQPFLATGTPGIRSATTFTRFSSPANVCFSCGMPGHWKHQ